MQIFVILPLHRYARYFISSRINIKILVCFGFYCLSIHCLIAVRSIVQRPKKLEVKYLGVNVSFAQYMNCRHKYVKFVLMCAIYCTFTGR